MSESKKTPSAQPIPPTTDKAELSEDDLAQVSGGTNPKNAVTTDPTLNKQKVSEKAAQDMDRYIRG